MAKTTEPGKWATKKGYLAVEWKNGTKFTRQVYVVEKQKDGKTWKMFKSKAKKTLLATGVYTGKLKTLDIDLSDQTKKNARKEVLSAL